MCVNCLGALSVLLRGVPNCLGALRVLSHAQHGKKHEKLLDRVLAGHSMDVYGLVFGCAATSARVCSQRCTDIALGRPV